MESERVPQQAQSQINGERASQLSESGLANYNRGPQFYSDAERDFAAALAIKEQVYGLESIQVAEGLEQLSSIHKAMNDYAGAAKYLERAIKTFDVIAPTGLLPVSVTPSSMTRRLENLSDLYKVADQPDEVLRVQKLILERAK